MYQLCFHSLLQNSKKSTFQVVDMDPQPVQVFHQSRENTAHLEIVYEVEALESAVNKSGRLNKESTSNTTPM